jgi:hypothetical protein
MQNENGDTLLIAAIRQGNKKLVDRLLEFNVFINIPDKAHKNALDVAIDYDHPDIAGKLFQIKSEFNLRNFIIQLCKSTKQKDFIEKILTPLQFFNYPTVIDVLLEESVHARKFTLIKLLAAYGAQFCEKKLVDSIIENDKYYLRSMNTIVHTKESIQTVVSLFKPDSIHLHCYYDFIITHLRPDNGYSKKDIVEIFTDHGVNKFPSLDVNLDNYDSFVYLASKKITFPATVIEEMLHPFHFGDQNNALSLIVESGANVRESNRAKRICTEAYKNNDMDLTLKYLEAGVDPSAIACLPPEQINQSPLSLFAFILYGGNYPGSNHIPISPISDEEFNLMMRLISQLNYQAPSSHYMDKKIKQFDHKFNPLLDAVIQPVVLQKIVREYLFFGNPCKQPQIPKNVVPEENKEHTINSLKLIAASLVVGVGGAVVPTPGRRWWGK